MSQINEVLLTKHDEQFGSKAKLASAEHQPTDAATDASQHINGTADSAHSPFRIKKNDGRPKKGALGFKPLLRSSSKPPQSVRNGPRPQCARPEPAREQPTGANLLPVQHLSPSAFQTPAITRSLHHLNDGFQPSSGMLQILQDEGLVAVLYIQHILMSGLQH